MYKPKTFVDEISLLDPEVAQRAKLDGLIKEQEEYKDRILKIRNQIELLKSELESADKYGFCNGLIQNDISILQEKIKDLCWAKEYTYWAMIGVRQAGYRRLRKLKN